MQLGFFFGVPAYFRVCFRILGREDVDLVDLAMALDWRPKTKNYSSCLSTFILRVRIGSQGAFRMESQGAFRMKSQGAFRMMSQGVFRMFLSLDFN